MRNAKDWTPEAVMQLVQARNNGEEFDAIAAALDRTPSSCRARYRRETLTPEELVIERAENLARWKRQRERERAAKLAALRAEATPALVIPTYVIADLARRLSIVPTFDNLLTGTPLPTCSCLDRPAGLYYAR